MTDHWNFYFCRVDGKSASIFVNVGARENAPIVSLPNLSYVRLYMRHSQNDGLSSREEFKTLCIIEDRINQLISEYPDQIKLVGRNTSGGYRDFYFYSAEKFNIKSFATKVMIYFPNYKYESGTHPDPKWNTYFNFLYPSEEDWQFILNR